MSNNTFPANFLRFHRKREDVRQHLAELGFVAGQEVTVVSSLNGNLIINVKGSRIALDETMARRVML